VTRHTDLQQLRMMTKVAWLYHNGHLRQREIADRLAISQSRVSRLLDLAVAEGVVRTTVVAPEGLHAEVEEALEKRYGLLEAHVFDVAAGDEEDENDLVRSLGQSVAHWLQAHPFDADILGFTSWSRSLRATVAALPRLRSNVRYVVELLGDVGRMSLQDEAAQATRDLAKLTGAEPRFLRTPGVVRDRELREALLAYDPEARTALELLENMQLALVGIGTCDVDAPLVAGENFFTDEQFQRARELGAVGQVNLRFIAADGTPVVSELDEHVVGVTLDQLRRADRVLAVAGGRKKYAAIRASLLGGWVNALVTDLTTAERLVAEPRQLNP
jgi:DNA-binding transcriptional regulator LsrR (DeoR family)